MDEQTNQPTDWSDEAIGLCNRFQGIIEPCPFCGKHAVLFLGPFKIRKPYVQCMGKDDDKGCGAIVEGDCITAAVTKWNKRAPMDSVKEKLAKLQTIVDKTLSDIYMGNMHFASELMR